MAEEIQMCISRTFYRTRAHDGVFRRTRIVGDDGTETDGKRSADPGTQILEAADQVGASTPDTSTVSRD